MNKRLIYLIILLAIIFLTRNPKPLTCSGMTRPNPASVPLFTVAYGYQDAAGSLWFVTPGGGVIVSHSPSHPFEIVGDIEAVEIIRLDENRLLINEWEKLGVFDVREKKLVASKIPSKLLPTNSAPHSPSLWA